MSIYKTSETFREFFCLTKRGDDVDITIDIGDIDKQIKYLEKIKKGGRKAVAVSMNKAVKEMKKTAKTSISREYTVGQNAYIAGIKVYKARTDSWNPTAFIHSTVRPINLRKFQYRANTRPGKKGGLTVFAKVKKSGGGRTGGFIAKQPNGAKAIFKRRGKTHLPIDRLNGPSGTELLNNKNVSNDIQKTAKEIYEKNLAAEINKLLRG